MMINWFEKGLIYTLITGFCVLGVITGLVLLKIIVGVTGWLLGSSLGTIILCFVLYKIYKRAKKDGWLE